MKPSTSAGIPFCAAARYAPASAAISKPPTWRNTPSAPSPPTPPPPPGGGGDPRNTPPRAPPPPRPPPPPPPPACGGGEETVQLQRALDHRRLVRQPFAVQSR